MAIMTPSAAAVRPRRGALPDSVATNEMPSTENANSSGDPMYSITGRRIGIHSAISAAPNRPPSSEDM